ncbi:MAG TPA: histidine phosphatase family protein [Acidimicrobiia bacterium]|nr:histidine phosphatase family protein [Acidimicrobiia bacterium]
MAITIVFETHALSEDNELGIASGWTHSRLSERGRDQALELGARRRDEDLAAVFSSDLRRAVETAEVAFGESGVPILLDWRLRECDYGERNAEPAEAHGQDRAAHVDEPFPGGESWRQAIARVGSFLRDLTPRWDGTRVVVIGHVATRWGLDHYVNGVALEDLVNEVFEWKPGWEYRLEPVDPS